MSHSRNMQSKIKREVIENEEKSGFDMEIENKMRENDLMNFIPNKFNDELGENFDLNSNHHFVKDIDMDNDYPKLRCENKIDNELIRNLNKTVPSPTVNKISQLFTKENTTSIPTSTAYSNKEKFQIKLKEMKLSTESYFENIKNNFISYIENQKSHLMGCLNIIEDIVELEQGTPEVEEPRNKLIDKKLEEFTKELNIVICDLHKFTK